mgnify:CR=1 FL=1
MRCELKIKRINVLMNRIENGENISMRSIARLLTTGQMLELKEDLKVQVCPSKSRKPKAIKKYETLLRRGLLVYGRYEATNHTQSAYGSRRLAYKAEAELEKALEYANELIYIDSSFRLWFDLPPH